MKIRKINGTIINATNVTRNVLKGYGFNDIEISEISEFIKKNKDCNWMEVRV